ncbi:MAG: HEAT repeat domain-containing protein, partial [Blastocatellia bacterium]|nr:HEAT repeat domain-containing protein [Blastocatellia bacterium]
IAFLLVIITSIILLLTIVLIKRLKTRAYQHQFEKLSPYINTEISDYIVGACSCEKLASFYNRYPRQFEEILTSSLLSVSGIALVRLSQLASDIGLVADLEHMYQSKNVQLRRKAVTMLGLLKANKSEHIFLKALSDVDQNVRFSTAKAILNSGHIESLDKVFKLALDSSLIVRAILSEELKKHALLLSENIIPEILQSKEIKQIITTLEIIESWQKLLPIPNFIKLLEHHDLTVRSKAIQVIHYNLISEDVEPAILKALQSEDVQIKISAARAAGHLGIAGAKTLLLECLEKGDLVLALAASYALIEIDPQNIRELQNFNTSKNRIAATATLEALE